jgi:hypothetical protein
LSTINQQELGLTYVDVAALSHTRPDAAVGARLPSAAQDCVHTCLPGPVDEYVRLLFHALRHDERRVAVPAPRAAPLRFHAAPLEAWFRAHELGTPLSLKPRLPEPYTCLAYADWWPFRHCDEKTPTKGVAQRAKCVERRNRTARTPALSEVISRPTYQNPAIM